MRTSAPGAAVPEMVGVLSGVDCRRVGEAITGGSGRVFVATVKLRAGEGALVLPALSVAVAVRLCEPSESGPAIEHSKLPAASATTLQATVLLPSTKIFTVKPGSALPETVGEGLVRAPSAGAVTVGDCGAVASIITVRDTDDAFMPALFEAVATKLCGPSESAVPTVQLQAPRASAVVVHTGVVPPSAKREMGAFGAAVPLRSGVESVSRAFCVGEAMTGDTGAAGPLVRANLALGATPGTVAVSSYEPSVPLAVAATVTRPAESVMVVPTIDAAAPEAGGVNVTATFDTGLPCASVTITTSIWAKGDPTTALCGEPLTTTIEAAGPAVAGGERSSPRRHARRLARRRWMTVTR